eukprot:353851-Chlamydomonas_euryale.AAC.17
MFAEEAKRNCRRCAGGRHASSVGAGDRWGRSATGARIGGMLAAHQGMPAWLLTDSASSLAALLASCRTPHTHTPRKGSCLTP